MEHVERHTLNSLKNTLKHRLDEYILQEKINGIEYTVQVFSDLNS